MVLKAHNESKQEQQPNNRWQYFSFNGYCCYLLSYSGDTILKSFGAELHSCEKMSIRHSLLFTSKQMCFPFGICHWTENNLKLRGFYCTRHCKSFRQKLSPQLQKLNCGEVFSSLHYLKQQLYKQRSVDTLMRFQFTSQNQQ